MKKKICNRFLSIMLALLIMCQGIIYSSTAVLHASALNTNFQSLNVSTSSNGQVFITGNVIIGASQMVTVKVVNPNNGIDYIDQTLSLEEGYFQFSYTNQLMIDGGLYRVYVSTNGENEPTLTTFTYKAGSDNSNDDEGNNNENDGNNSNSNSDNKSNNSKNNNKKEEIRNKNGKIQIHLPKPTFDVKKREAKSTINNNTIEESFQRTEADSKGIKKVEIVIPEVVGAKGYEIDIPKEQLTSGTINKVLELDTSLGLVSFPTNIMQGIGNHTIDTFSIEIKESEKDNVNSGALTYIGERPMIDVDVVLNDEVIHWQNNNAPITIKIPYTPLEDEIKKPEHIIIYYINEQGEEIPVPNGRYDASLGAVVFKTKHLSKFAIAFVSKTFKDLETFPWVDDEISVLASKGIINGTSDDTFSPSENIKRADFIVLLIRALELHSDIQDNFSDVNKESYYYEAVGIAKSLGITEGIGDNKFVPEASITRQDMMVLTQRALETAGVSLEDGSKTLIDSFGDNHYISDYAVNSVATLINAGLILGDGSNIHPKEYTTRAEIASLIYKLYYKVHQ